MFEGRPAYPFAGRGMVHFWPIVLFAVAISVCRGTNRRKMNGLLRPILVLPPMGGFAFLTLYPVIRVPGGMRPVKIGDTVTDLLRQRYLRGEMDEEGFRKRENELERRD